MSGESELTILQSTGSSPWRMARPVFAYGLSVAAMMSVLTHFLVPMAQAQLTQREAEIARNVTNGLLTEGTFLHPAENVTFYTRQIDADGVLRDVFLSDRRDPDEGVIYTAAEAYLVRNEVTNQPGTTLIMVDGMAQRLGAADNRLATAQFRDFSFDISTLVRDEATGWQSIRTMATPALLVDWTDLAARTGNRLTTITEEFHLRFTQPLFCVVAALLGFATLLVGGYSRFGVWREAAIAFALLVTIDGFRGAAVDLVRQDPDAWPFMYLPSAVGLVLTLAMLTHAAHPGWLARLRRRRAAP